MSMDYSNTHYEQYPQPEGITVAHGIIATARQVAMNSRLLYQSKSPDTFNGKPQFVYSDNSTEQITNSDEVGITLVTPEDLRSVFINAPSQRCDRRTPYILLLERKDSTLLLEQDEKGLVHFQTVEDGTTRQAKMPELLAAKDVLERAWENYEKSTLFGRIKELGKKTVGFAKSLFTK